MAKYKLQEMPDVHNTGKRKVYPKMVTNRTLSRKEFVKKICLHQQPEPHRRLPGAEGNHRRPNFADRFDGKWQPQGLGEEKGINANISQNIC